MNILFRLIVKKTLSFFNFSIAIKVNGHKFKVPLLGELGIANRKIRDKWMLDVLKLIIPISGSKFIDVGANIGQTLIKVKSIKKDIPYIGFEPNPACLFYIDELIKINTLKQTTLIPTGIGHNTSIGSLHFYSKDSVESSASTNPNFRRKKTINRKNVALFSVSDLKKDIDFKDMSIIKIDVEGSELQVIEEFKDLIEEHSPFIIIEILPVYDPSENPERLSNQNKIDEILSDLNYYMFRIKKEKDRLKEFKRINTFEIHSNLNNCDYLMVPMIKKEAFQKAIKTT